MTRIKVWMIGAACFPVAVAVAQDFSYYNRNTASGANWRTRYDSADFDKVAGVFRGDEVSIDLFGSYSLPQETMKHLSTDRIHDDGRAGAGIGVTGFFTRHLGLGVD